MHAVSPPPADLQATTPAQAAPTELPRFGLQWRLQAIVTVLVALVLGVLAWQHVQATRGAVREEILASNHVATQLLRRVGWVVSRSGGEAMQGFLDQLGRVRANDLTLLGADGRVLYRSPASPYKQGRDAPAWYSELVSPPPQRQEVLLDGGARLLIEADASRAVLDGWDSLGRLVLVAGSLGLALLALSFAAIRHTLKPLRMIEQGLERLRAGDFSTRLPALPGRESRLIGEAVNRLGATLESQIAERVLALDTQRRLAESRDWAQRIEERLEAERRLIAGELHDELGQSVTAIRSLARSLGARLPEDDKTGRQAADLIDSEAAQLYDAMHGLIPRLTPLALDPAGLPDALRDLLAGLRARHPDIVFQIQVAPGLPDPAQPAVALAAYRVAQEGLNNAIKHSGARQLDLALRAEAGRLRLDVLDDGCGLPPPEQRRGRLGLLGLGERVRALGGELEAGTRPEGGTRLSAWLPTAGPEVRG